MQTDTDVDGQQVFLLDTSTAIALILEDHKAHALTLAAVHGRRLGLAGHAWFETYSVLTRLPAGLRRSPADAFRLLAHNFPESRVLGEVEATELTTRLAEAGVAGGSVYDALVASAARQHNRTLVTGDTRARPVYDALGIPIEVIPS